MENSKADEFERGLQETFRDAELEPSQSLWENIATSSELKSNSFEGSMRDIFSEAQAKPTDDVWNRIAQSPERYGSLEQQVGAVFQDATLQPSPDVWANIEKQLHQKRFPKRVLWRVGGVAASLLLASGVWWYSTSNQDVVSTNNTQNSLVNHKKNNKEQNTELSGDKFTGITPLKSDSETNQISTQDNIAQENSKNTKLPTSDASNIDESNGFDNVEKKILATSGHESKNGGSSEKSTENLTSHLISDSKQELIESKSPEQVEKIELLSPIKMLDAGLLLAETQWGEPVLVVFDVPKLAPWYDQPSKLKLTPFIGVSASSENFTANFKGNETAISEAIQSGITPFTQSINSYDNDLHLALQDSITNVQSVRYGLDFGLEVENLLKKGALSVVSGAYLTQTEFAVQNSFTRETVIQAVSDTQTFIANPLQNRMQILSIPVQLMYTSGGNSNLGFRVGTGLETNFVLQDEWTNPSQELAYDLGQTQTHFNYVLSGGVVYKLGEFAELGLDVSRSNALNSMYQSDYLTARPLRINYGGHFRIKF